MPTPTLAYSPEIGVVELELAALRMDPVAGGGRPMGRNPAEEVGGPEEALRGVARLLPVPPTMELVGVEAPLSLPLEPWIGVGRNAIGRITDLAWK